MRIISWNCNMSYATKQKELLAFQPDVAIIQECSEKSVKACGATFSHWVGKNPQKGLAVAGFGNHAYTLDPSYTDDYPWFLPFRVDDEQLNILAVWAHVKNQRERYVRITHRAIDHYKTFLERGVSIIIGDFNSNTIWDKKYTGESHSELVNKLEQFHLKSIYHYQTQEVQGRETLATFYMYRHKDRGYHIDYAFLSTCLLAKTRLLLPDPEFWLTRSDHVPLILEIHLG